MSASPAIMKETGRPSIFLTWLPLAVMWIIMAVEQPVIAAVLARMNDEVLQLAAFGVAFSLALFIEGPVVQMLAAGTALADSRGNYHRTLTMMHLIGGSATFVHILLCIPAIFEPFARSVLGIPESLIDPARMTLLVMIPWTLGVGYRRLWQGVLIRHGRAKLIPITMAVRIIVSFLVLAWGFSSGKLPGAVLGGLALSLGVIGGAVAARFYVNPTIRGMPSSDGSPGGIPGDSRSPLMSRWAIFIFYLPLALTNFLNLGARPVMQMGLARGPLPMESLAIWPVSMGFLFLFTSFSLSSQEVVIARLEDSDSRRALILFNSLLGVVLGGLYIIVLATPLWRLWFAGVSGLSDELTSLSRSPLILSIPVIPLSAWISLFRGALVRHRRTREVTLGIAVNVTVLLTSLFIGVAILPIPAISTVSAAYALGFIAEFLFLAARRPLKDIPGLNR